MNYAEFQERYEQDGEAEYERYLAMPTEALLEAVRMRQLGEQFQLWPAIAAKATLQQAGWPLFDIVTGDAPYLIRYHAAHALLVLLQSERFTAAGLAVASSQRMESIAAVEEELRQRTSV